MADEKAWREFDEDISMMQENTLKGTSKRKLEVMIWSMIVEEWDLELLNHDSNALHQHQAGARKRWAGWGRN